MSSTQSSAARCAAALAVCLLAGLSFVHGSIKGSSHDFRDESWSGGQVCIPCHTSHGGTEQGYAWNHAVPADEVFVKREGSNLGFGSLLCLGCHDGQTAMDSFGEDVGNTRLTGRTVVGRDLRAEHPVGVVYPESSGRHKFKDAASVKGSLRLFDGRVECSTCHDPHSNVNGKYLRVPSRDLCQTCHDIDM